MIRFQSQLLHIVSPRRCESCAVLLMHRRGLSLCALKKNRQECAILTRLAFMLMFDCRGAVTVASFVAVRIGDLKRVPPPRTVSRTDLGARMIHPKRRTISASILASLATCCLIVTVRAQEPTRSPTPKTSAALPSSAGGQYAETDICQTFLSAFSPSRGQAHHSESEPSFFLKRSFYFSYTSRDRGVGDEGNGDQ
jgi:hypothetical protein